jgi:hypothetical protein
MAKFTDSTGQEWQVNIDVGSIDEIDDEFDKKYDLYNPQQDHGGVPLNLLLQADKRLFLQVLWVLVADQAAALQPPLEPKEFLRQRLGGQAFPDALEEFLKAWCDFFLLCGEPTTAELVGKSRELLAAAQVRLTSAVAGLDVAGAIDEIFASTSGSSPESPASIPLGEP